MYRVQGEGGQTTLLGAFTKATATCVVVGFMTVFHVLPGAKRSIVESHVFEQIRGYSRARVWMAATPIALLVPLLTGW